jgi:protein-S-isoprenylcysteine O-methyltransferase Ste14
VIRQMMVWAMTLSDALATYLVAYHSSSLFCPHFPPLSSATATTSAFGISRLLTTYDPRLTVSPFFVAGALTAISGNLLRQWCFRELGTLFTFEVTILPDHKLVTSGPYSYVRHPSYTGIYMTLLGPTLMALSPGSWLRECWFDFACSSRAASADIAATALSPASTLFTSVAPIQSSVSAVVGSETLMSSVLMRLPSVGQVIIVGLCMFWTSKVWLALKSTNKRMVVEDHELHGVFGDAWVEYSRRVPWKLVPGLY